MKAVTYTEYGGPEVLKLTEIDKPQPEENEVLIRVYAVPINYGDIIARNLKYLPKEQFYMPDFLFPIIRMAFGFNKPKRKILGSEFSGVIEAVGSKVNNFKPGDEVMGYPGAGFGANAEYICMKADGLLLGQKPENMSFQEASVLPYGALTALNVLRKVNIESGETRGKKVLINGASGSIGSFALQIVKACGAEVTGVASTSRVDYVKALGADHVVDYKKEDFTQNGKTYDLIVDILGKRKFSEVKNSLNKNGVHLLASFKSSALWPVIFTKLFGNKKSKIGMASYKPGDFEDIKKMVEQKKIRCIIDKSFTLEQTAEAHRYLESGKAKGNIVIKVH